MLKDLWRAALEEVGRSKVIDAGIEVLLIIDMDERLDDLPSFLVGSRAKDAQSLCPALWIFRV